MVLRAPHTPAWSMPAGVASCLFLGILGASGVSLWASTPCGVRYLRACPRRMPVTPGRLAGGMISLAGDRANHLVVCVASLRDAFGSHHKGLSDGTGQRGGICTYIRVNRKPLAGMPSE